LSDAAEAGSLGRGEDHPLRVLIDHRHFSLTLDPDQSLVRWTRTALAYDAVEEFEDVTRSTILALLPVDRTRHVLLIDLRTAPMRNDPAFEEAALRFRRDIHRGFARSAVLVKTRAGQLQIMRHVKERPYDTPDHPTFLEEEEALAYLVAVARS
jgi:hypothetical protein